MELRNVAWVTPLPASSAGTSVRPSFSIRHVNFSLTGALSSQDMHVMGWVVSTSRVCDVTGFTAPGVV
jgi:hypothetical protein